MSEDTKTVDKLEEILHREERKFLIIQFAQRLVDGLEEANGDKLGEQVIESLLVARPRVNPELANRITSLLQTEGRDEKWEAEPFELEEAFAEAEEVTNSRPSKTATAMQEEEEEDEGALDLEESEEEATGLFDGEEEEDDEEDVTEEEEDDEEATGLFEEDDEIAPSQGGQKDRIGKKENKKGKISKPARAKKKSGQEEDDEEDAPGFEATKGHEVEETPGFKATKGHEVEETPGFKATKGHEVEETPGFEATKGHEVEETPGFTAPELEDEDEDRFEAPEVEEKGSKVKTPAEAAKEKADTPEARRARAKEELDRRKKEPAAKKMQAQEEEEEVELDDLTYVISIEDMEKYLDITVLPDDKMKLQRRWKQKMLEPCIKQLVESQQSMEMPYALIPRLPRYLKDGKQVTTTVVNLLRAYPQFFENVPQVIKYKAEVFFLEAPELDWAFVSCEALPETLNQNYMQQGQKLKEYGTRHGAGQRRVRRRLMVEVLYDLIMVQLIHKENMLTHSVELTESKVGRQNFACINYGENGIRINDFGRQQTHKELGVCADW